MPSLRAGRISVSTLFLVHGLVVATWVSRIPAVQQKLGLSPASLGMALLGAAAGSLVAMPLAGWIIARRGSRGVAVAASLAFCSSLLFPAAATGRLTLTAALFCYGAAAGAMDVAMNVQGVVVETLYRRAIMSSLHALFSVGGLAGAALGGAIAARGVPPELHFSGAAAVLATMVLMALPGLPSTGVADLGRAPIFTGVPRVLLGLAALAFSLFLVEGAMADWSAVYLRNSLGSGPGTAAAGYAVFSGAMVMGRLAGDFLTERLGRAELVRAGSLLASAGLAGALGWGTVPAALLGFAITGIGCSAIVPLVFAASGRVHGMREGTGLAAATTAGYFGLLVGPPLIGFTAQWLSLRTALFVLVLLTLAGAALAGTVEPAPTHTRDAALAPSTSDVV